MSAAEPAIGARRTILPAAIFVLLATIPPLAILAGEGFLVLIATRAMIAGMAALALDLVLGVGGLIGFGHSAFIGIGAYAVGIAAMHGWSEGLVAFPLAILAAATFALATGAVSLRTRGVYFIMITLAFGQMAYFTATSLSAYGGENGLTLQDRSTVAGTGLLEGGTAFFYVVFVLLLAIYLICRIVVASRFGRVLRGCRQNPVRMQAIGVDPYRYQLFAYTMSGAIAGLAGALYANHSEFVSPALMSWHRSGELIVMVVLGGVGTLHGAIIGALAYFALEEVLAGVTEHWRMILGLLLVVIVLAGRGGLTALLGRGGRA
jgi:branched-chain amino acid transport system permease protein